MCYIILERKIRYTNVQLSRLCEYDHNNCKEELRGMELFQETICWNRKQRDELENPAYLCELNFKKLLVIVLFLKIKYENVLSQCSLSYENDTWENI